MACINLLLSLYEKGISYLQKETRRELLVAYQRYLNAFVNEDVDTINERDRTYDQLINSQLLYR